MNIMTMAELEKVAELKEYFDTHKESELAALYVIAKCNQEPRINPRLVMDKKILQEVTK